MRQRNNRGSRGVKANGEESNYFERSRCANLMMDMSRAFDTVNRSILLKFGAGILQLGGIMKLMIGNAILTAGVSGSRK